VVIYLFVSDDVIEWQPFWLFERQEVERGSRDISFTNC